MRNLVAAYKSGRAFNGCHRDAGTIIHLVDAMPESTSGFWGGKSLCGVSPGVRGNGWDNSQRPVNCDKCIKKQLKYSKP